MRVLSRLALVVLAVAVLSAPTAVADQFQADVPVDAGRRPTPDRPRSTSRRTASSASASQVFVLRGQTLTTYTVTDLGDMQIAREDFIGALAARETNGGVAFNNGFLYVCSEAGLEIFDLRNVRAGGTAPSSSRARRACTTTGWPSAATRWPALYPATDLPCSANQPRRPASTRSTSTTSPTRSSPVRVSSLSTFAQSARRLQRHRLQLRLPHRRRRTAAPSPGTSANPAAADARRRRRRPGTFLVSNGTNLLGVGNDTRSSPTRSRPTHRSASSPAHLSLDRRICRSTAPTRSCSIRRPSSTKPTAV